MAAAVDSLAGVAVRRGRRRATGGALAADALVEPWFSALRQHLGDIRLFDAHTHLGCADPDGSCFGPAELRGALDVIDARGVVFPLAEPGSYRVANERILAAAEMAHGRLVPFCRVDPHSGGLQEAERAVARGAAGIKLHPRAERFGLADPEVGEILAFADERRLPIIVHAGRGIPSLGRDALELARVYSSAPIILAHAAIADLAWIWREAAGRPNLFFDTAWWNTADQLALFALVPPGQILFASDTPYGRTVAAAAVVMRAALTAGLTAAQIAAVAGGQLERLLAGGEPRDLGPAPMVSAPAPGPLLERVHTLLVAAAGRLTAGYPADEHLQLARLACALPDDHPDAAAAASVRELLDRHADVKRESVAAAESAFRRAHPAYAGTAALDELRRSDFARLDAGGHVYLDYTGGGLFAVSQLREHARLLEGDVFGNPHSINPTSSASTALLERARAYVLDFFNASPEEYVAIFTPNATGALRLVGEAYPFRRGDRFLLTFDNHNSVNGIREFARARGAETTYVPSVAPELRVDENLLARYLTETSGDHHNLFAYPAQSNFSGVQHPLEWIERAHAHGWDVLLDAAAYVPTNRLDLGRWHPDFVVLSFYKMFGWPTGIGCLIARREALDTLERPWFSGGTIVAAFVQRPYHEFLPGAPHFEDGTLDYLNLPAVEIGLRFLDRIGMATVHSRVAALGAWLLDALGSLEHSDGSPAATVYGPRSWRQRGATIAFNFLHPDGRVVDERYVDRVAGRHRISLRTGCFCNPGAGEIAFTISRETLLGGEFGPGRSLDDYASAIGLPSGGAIRASLGVASNFLDVHRFIEFAAEFIDLTTIPGDLPERHAC